MDLRHGSNRNLCPPQHLPGQTCSSGKWAVRRIRWPDRESVLHGLLWLRMKRRYAVRLSSVTFFIFLSASAIAGIISSNFLANMDWCSLSRRYCTTHRHDPGPQLAGTAQTADGALSFVSRFGFLSNNGHLEIVESICHQMEVLRTLGECIDREDWTTLTRWIDDNAKAIRLHPVLNQRDGYPRPDLFFAPDTLIDAIYLQALQDATSATDLRKCDCPGCPEWAAVGPGTGRWRTGRPTFYCTPKCQKAHQYMRKKGKAK